jgi:hypothetical protein
MVITETILLASHGLLQLVGFYSWTPASGLLQLDFTLLA